MNQTILELSNRINNLELVLHHVNQSESKLSQVDSLRKHLATVYKEHPELVKFNQILTDLKLWNTLQEASVKEDISQELKQELILSSYPTIKQINSNLNELTLLSSTVIDQLSLDIQTTNITSSKYMLVSYKDEIKRIKDVMTMLILKNMIVYEQYIQLIIKENNNWLQIDEKLSKLNSKIIQIESIQMHKNKY